MNTSVKVFPDSPESQGIKNALLRAKQLSELKWTPIRPFPATMPSPNSYIPSWHNREGVNWHMPAWRPQTGANYSAARYDEKYIGINVSIETFMTALSNPESVLYTRSLHGRHYLSSAFYGTVCSEFVSYVLDMPFHIDCQQWPFLDGIIGVNTEPLENLKLCDIILERTHHIAIITGINRDERGNILDITVTESTQPKITTQVFSPKEFKEYWLKNNYEILRYKKTDKITYSPNPWIQLNGEPCLPNPVPNSVLMPDYGNKANYLKGEPVIISVFDSEYTVLELTFNGTKTRYPVEDGRVVLKLNDTGYYKAVAVAEDHQSSDVEFCIVDASVTTNKMEYQEGDEVFPSFFCEADDELRGWVIKTDSYAKYWGYPIEDNGKVPQKTTLPKGKYLIIALYRNRFGTYSSKPHFFDVYSIS